MEIINKLMQLLDRHYNGCELKWEEVNKLLGLLFDNENQEESNYKKTINKLKLENDILKKAFKIIKK